MDLKHQIAIVTRAGIGMGRGIAEKLAHCGAAVVVADRSRESAADAAAAIERAGSRAIAVAADISKLNEIVHMFDVCQEKLGTPDILVANAGISRPCPITEVTEEFFDSIYNVNAKGTFFCLKEAGSRLNDRGRIVVISSCSARLPELGMSVYSSSKAATQLMVDVAALEFAPRGITVNSILPGLTETPTMLRFASQEHRQKAIEKTPLGRLGTVQDIAEIAAFLASKESQWITGQHILANGGCLSNY